MFDKLEVFKKRNDEINEMLYDPNIVSDQEKYKSLMKEQKNLIPIVEKYEEYKIYLHFPLFNVLRAKSSISDQKFGEITDLKVSKTTVNADKNGFSTEVTLVKEK